MSKGGGQSSAPAKTTTVADVPKRFRPFFDRLVREAESQFETNQQAQVPELGVAPFDPASVAAQNQILQLAGGPISDFSNLLLGTSAQNLTDFLDPNSAVVQNAASAAVNPAIRAFQEQVLPSLERGSVLTGNVGSSRAGVAQGLASDALARNVLDTSAQVTNQAFQTGLDQMVRTLALGPQTLQTALAGPLATAGVGEQRQEQAQRELDTGTAQQIAEQEQGNVALSNFANILFGLPGGSSTVTQTAAQGGGGGIQSAIGLGLQGASLAGRLFPAVSWATPVGAGLGILAGLLG